MLYVAEWIHDIDINGKQKQIKREKKKTSTKNGFARVCFGDLYKLFTLWPLEIGIVLKKGYPISIMWRTRSNI